jgi:hypothetical protein
MAVINVLDFDSRHSNPYAAPATTDFSRNVSDSGDAEQIRRKHLSHETSLRSTGALYIIGFVMLLFLAISFSQTLVDLMHPEQKWNTDQLWAFGLCALPLSLGVWQLVIGIGLRKLKASARIPATIVAVLWMLWIPFGTIISGYFLYLFWSSKSRVVMSDEYHEIMKQTPHIKHPNSWFILIVLFLLIAFLIANFVWFV